MALVRFPPEILHEIVSHLPQTYSSYDALALGAPRLTFTREDTLRALCTTCHRLRLRCFPFLWERFYAEPLTSAGGMMLTSHAVNVPLRRLRKLLVAPHIWPHIRSLSVAFLRSDEIDDGTLSVLIQILRRLPTLLSLTFSAVSAPQIPLVLGAFESKAFIDVRELAIGTHELGALFRAFPGVDKLRVPWGRGRTVFCLENAGKAFVNLTWLCCLTLGEPVATAIVAHCPRVQRIDFAVCPDRDQLVLLRRLRHLTYLSFRFATSDKPKAGPIVSLAKAILRASVTRQKDKVVRVDWVGSYEVNVVKYSEVYAVER
ncbi:hypothetical protein HMN09_00298400 [Mycena chlorophos]|uniref:Uncharacterized protein n=1 Tax=Mycena chlorophos TaxID=658473 RepID=A0A8H6TKS7_MYCCL|nr:hypothetical protein HMN09_00298400 [Mycena chlorophos]